MSYLNSILFYPERQKNNLFWLNLPKKYPWENIRIFEKNHGLANLENLGFLDLIKTSLFWSKKYSFLSTISKNDLFWLICPKNTHEKIFEFVTKTWTNRFGTFGFFGVFSETLLSLCEKHSFYLEHQKPNFSCLICPKNTQEKIFDFFTKTMH